MSSSLSFKSEKCFASSSATLRKSEKKYSGNLAPSFPSRLPTFQSENLQQMSIARSIAYWRLSKWPCGVEWTALVERTHNSIQASACRSFARLSTVPPLPLFPVSIAPTTLVSFTRGGSVGGGRSAGDEIRVNFPARKRETRMRVRATLVVGSGVRRMRRQKDLRVFGGEERS